MAKKGKGKGKLPKTVAGVKVPKTLRKAAAGTLLDSPLAREILADMLIAAAGAAAAALVKERPTGQQVADAGEAVVDAGGRAAGATRDAVQGAAEAVTETVAGAARQILPASMTGTGEDDEGDGDNERSAKEGYSHLADRTTKGKKDKNRSKASKH